VDEEKDPYYIEGKNHRNAMNYSAAIEAFERSVQSNPRNAAAHFELGVLYEQTAHDFVSALYHYEKHLKLRPKSEYKDAIEPRVKTCKLELMKHVTFGVVSAEVQRDLVKLTNEIGNLRQENATVRAQLAAKPMIVTQWMTLRVTNFVNVTQRVVVAAAPQPQAPVQQPVANPTPTPPAVQNQTTGNPATQRPTANPSTRTPAPATQAPATPTPRAPVTPTRALTAAASGSGGSALTATTVKPAPRAHKVEPGETFEKIARRYGMTTQKLQEANRGLDPRRLRPGQTLNLP
jgi:LysM repeat protein